MSLQQQSANRYMINGCLVAITSFAWLSALYASLIITTGIQVLHNNLYAKLTASWVVAIIITMIKRLDKLTLVDNYPVAPVQESHDQEKWKLEYNDELIFYFGNCISFPERYQDYTDPPG